MRIPAMLRTRLPIEPPRPADGSYDSSSPFSKTFYIEIYIESFEKQARTFTSVIPGAISEARGYANKWIPHMTYAPRRPGRPTGPAPLRGPRPWDYRHLTARDMRALRLVAANPPHAPLAHCGLCGHKPQSPVNPHMQPARPASA
jgi:hypothetical protein